MEQKKAIGIWIRVSTEEQVKDESPEHHEKRARLYAESKGWEVREVYRLEAVSGKSVMQHPEAKKMLRDIKDGVITGLIFSKLARLARNTKELLDFADIFKEYNADLVSLHEAIDTSTPAGRLFYTMIAAMAQWEREEIASRIQASIPIRAKLGKRIGGHPPFGYQWVNEELVLEEKEAPVRKLMYELFLKMKRKKAVAKELNTLGYRTKNGSKFTDSTIDRLLRDSTAMGQRISNHTKTLENKSWVYKPKEEWIIHPCPALVSEDIWNECNRLLEEHRKKNQQVGPRPVHLLSGYVYCDCTKKMYVYHKDKTYFCKSCKTKIKVEDIDEIFHEQLKAFLLTDMDLNQYLKESDEKIKEKENLLLVSNNESDALRKQMNELVKMRMNQEMQPESFKSHYKPLEERMLQLENQIPELQGEIDFLKIQYMSSDTVIRDAQTLYEQWPLLDFESKRTIIEIITEKISIGREDIHIRLAYLPTSLRNGGNSQRDFLAAIARSNSGQPDPKGHAQKNPIGKK